MIPGSANPLLLKTAAAAAGGYQVERSLRFNSSDSGFCGRTFGTATSRKTWTWAGWIKRSYVGATYKMLFSADNGAHSCGFRFTNSPSDTIEFFEYNGGFTWQLVTTQVFRDPSAWYHIVVVFDSTQGTSTNRLKLYVNGTQVTAFGTASYPSLNYDSLINAAVAHNIGAYAGIQNFDGYLADIHFIDGQALTPSSFTEVSATTGQLLPKAYSGSFGTNGFWLKFSDNSAATAAALGNDYSGNNNDWTPNNLSVTAGAGNDSLVDTPTSTGTDTGVGNEVRGNYATWNPLANGATLSNGNLDITGPASGYGGSISTIALDSGKYYWEYTVTNNYAQAAICGISARTVAPFSSLSSADEVYYQNNYVVTNGSTTSGLNTIVAGDVIGITWDGSSNQIKFYRNNSLQTTVTASSGKTYFAGFGGIVNNTASINFGQRAFAYPVSGYKALVDTNLGAPVVAKPNTLMDVALYTGNGSTQTISGLGFSPDLVWLRNRTQASNWVQFDTVRGALIRLVSNLTVAEASLANSLTSFDSTGFTYGSEGSGNNNGDAFAAFCWDAGTSTVSNTQGSITSQVRANVSAGFSIVKFTPSGAGQITVGHGLGASPGFIIVKTTNLSANWYQWVTSFTVNEYLTFTTAAKATSANFWGTNLPSSTVFGYNAGGSFDHIAYCFSPVVGYSSFGSYTGGTQGTFVYLGFTPKWLLVKSATGSVGDNWKIYDSSRSSYNVRSDFLAPNTSGVETTGNLNQFDFVSNGFVVRTNPAYDTNNSGITYIYAAFAENPFQYARAR